MAAKIPFCAEAGQDLVSDLAYVLQISPNGSINVEWATEAFSKTINLYAIELVQQEAWQSLIYPEDMPIALEMIQRLLDGKTDERELRVVIKNGDVRWVRNYARPEWNADQNRVVRIFGAMQDITDSVQADKKIQRRNEEISRLYRASETLIYSETPTPKHLAEAIVKAVLEEFGKSNCSLLLIEKHPHSTRSYLKRVAVAGPYSHEANKATLTLDGLGVVPKAIRLGQTINTPDVSKCADYLPNWEAARSELTIPLKVGGKVIGALDIQSTEIEAFNENDERLMSVFANRAASALENARLYEQTQEHLRQITALRHIDNAIIGAVDLRPILRILLVEVKNQLAVDAVDVLLYNPHMQTLECAARQGFQTSALQHTYLRLGEGYAGKAAKERRMIHVEDIFKDESELNSAPLLVNENFTAYYGVPLIAKGEIKGVLEIFHRTNIDPTLEWLELLETLSGQAAIAIDNATMFDSLQRSNTELLRAYDATLEGWVQALDMRDKETEHHTQRVTKLTVELAQAIGVSDEKLTHIRRGALLHDIGKMGIPDSILLKKGELKDSEWKIMREHPIYAQRFLAKIDYLRPALDIPYSHHEKWDGTGYPQQLKGKEIPMAARIFAIADVWDALRSDRPYRNALPKDEVFAYIQEQSGKHFDPALVDIFIKMITEKPELI
ncbi:MAG: GAF domain-containing protein [Anaerolineae bacterium]|nr:GAF domain-containing protein [Anaerolineae bacterium]MBT7072438.1 GAF domain-containing protein [Anaerolineae bacterium]MBT7326565.1 GAF domain-containing protein [Anaerolineae bacterium]